MVIRFESSDNKLANQDIYLVEATSSQGVRIKKWSDIKPGIGTFYESIALRRVHFERTD